MTAITATSYRQRSPVQVLTGGAEVIDQIAEEWRRLCDGPYDEPFYRPEWIEAYVRAFASDKTLVLATARRNGRLVAVLPLIRETALLGGVPVRKLRGAANVHTCRFDVVHSPLSRKVAVRAIWEAVQAIPGWDVLELPSVPIGGAGGDVIRLAQTQGCVTHATRCVSTPYIDLSGGAQAFENVLRGLDAKFRSNLRRRARRLERVGSVQLVCGRQADERLRLFYELERQGWKGRERSAIACGRATTAFYDDVARQAASAGALRLYALECCGRPVAMHYGVLQGGRYFLLKTAYDESLKACAPGQLIMERVLRDLTAEGCSRFDFLGTLMDWKKEWAPRLRPHASWYVFRGPVGRVAYKLRFGLGSTIARKLRARARKHEP